MKKATTDHTPASGSARRKPYEKPAFQHERVFETMALSCGKRGANEGQCIHNRKVS
jgi:hypothetical protein